MTRCQVRIPQRHRDMFVPHQFLDRGEIDASHYEPTCKRVPKIMKREVGDSSPLHSPRERLCHLPIPKHRSRPISSRRYLKALQRRCQCFTRRHTAGFMSLCVCRLDLDQLVTKINAPPFQGQQLGFSKSCVQSGDYERLELDVAIRSQTDLFFFRQESCAGIVFTK